MAVDFNNLFNRGGFKKGRRNAFFYSQDNTTACRYADGGRSKLDRFKRVFYLKEPPFRREGAAEIWLDVGFKEKEPLIR
jgi:hypothetical protein